MLIAQISDFHVTAPGRLAYGCVDTGAALAAAVVALNALDPQPDWVIGTGDLTQGGLDGEYAALRQILGALKAPFLPLLGNHDRREAFRRAFADLGVAFGPAPYVQYAVNLGGVRLLALDTVQEGSDEPAFDDRRLAWLRARLAEVGPALLAMHHPPFPAGVDWLEPADPNWSQPIGEVVQQVGSAAHILCGHVHRTMFRTWRGVSATTAPSTAHQVALRLSAGAPAELAHEAPGFLLHQWTGADLITYGASSTGFTDRFRPGAPA